MKKVLISFIVTSIVFVSAVLGFSLIKDNTKYPHKVALITDYADVNDNSFNQQTYEGCKYWCDQNNIPFAYYKPSTNSAAERGKCIEIAIERGYDVLYLPGYSFGPVITEYAPRYQNVIFVGIDVSPADFASDYVPTNNVVCFSYDAEIAGYLAGFGVAKDGYRKHSFLGGLPAPAVTLFAYGYAQGLNDAAKELKLKDKIDLNIVYAGQFFGDNDITKYVDGLYKSGTEIVFSCGGSVYTSVALAAKDNNGKMVGVDVDQSTIIDRNYAPNICVTSALKCMKATCYMSLNRFVEGKYFDSNFVPLGLVSSSNLDENYVGLPLENWRFKNFTIEEYSQIVDDILSNKRQIGDDLSKPLDLEYVNIHELGNIK